MKMKCKKDILIPDSYIFLPDKDKYIEIDYLLKELTEAVFNRELKGDDMKVIHHIIAKWREQNDGRETD